MTEARASTNDCLAGCGERYVVYTNNYGKDNFADMHTRRDKTARSYLTERIAGGDTVAGRGHIVPPELNPVGSFYRRIPALAPLLNIEDLSLPPTSSVLSSEVWHTNLDLTTNLKAAILRTLNRDYSRNRGTSNVVSCLFVCRCNYETV